MIPEKRPLALARPVNRYPFPLPTRPGLGVEFDEDAIADHPHSLTDMPHFHKPDGSHINWQAAPAMKNYVTNPFPGFHNKRTVETKQAHAAQPPPRQ